MLESFYSPSRKSLAKMALRLSNRLQYVAAGDKKLQCLHISCHSVDAKNATHIIMVYGTLLPSHFSPLCNSARTARTTTSPENVT